MEPPNPMEAQQLRLFTKQNRLRFEFTEATFSFTDDTFDQLAAKVHWAPSGATADDLLFYQPRESKDRSQSYSDYVAVVLANPDLTSQKQTLEFHYAGKRAIRK